MARKYTPKGGNGGKREGSGRKPGSTNALALGEVAAVNAAGLRVPESASPAQKSLADRALQRIAAVMEEKVGYLQATAVLKASTVLREEICGPVKQKVEHSFDGLTDAQLETRFRALTQFPRDAGQTTQAAPDGAAPEGAGPGRAGETNEADSQPESDEPEH